MKKTLWVVVVVLVFHFLYVPMSFAQNPTPTSDVEERLNRAEEQLRTLEREQETVLRVSTQRIEQLQTFLNGLGIFFGAFVVISGMVAAVAAWRQARQQESLTGVSIKSTESASQVLQVVREILENRLLDVTKRDEEVIQLKTQLETVAHIIHRLEAGIGFQRDRLESKAGELSQTARHEFKKSAEIETLNVFARDFDRFKMLYPEELELNGQCLYIRAVAAVFNNQFEILQDYLSKVIELDNPDKGENKFSYSKRLANTYYYLGLFHSNLGESRDAVRLLEQAHDIDPEGTDFLTLLVTAEVYVMHAQYEKAEKFLQEFEKRLDDQKRKQGNKLMNHQARMLSRAYLIRANMVIIARRQDWKGQARQFAEKACDIDPEHYYALLTLGQIIREIEGGTDTDQVKNYFGDAYSKIQHSGHLHFVRETRSRILLLMVSALCGKHGGMADEGVVDTYLDEARLLRDDLPRVDSRVSTVFSPLSKQNVNRETTGSHIEEIRKGTWSLHPD